MATTHEVLTARAAIDAEVDGKTLGDMFARNAETYGERPAISWQEGGEWKTLTWREYRERVADVTLGLKSLGVGRGDFVAIMTRNRPEHVIADMGAVHAGATPVSFYNTLAPEQISYIANHCEAKVAIVEGREFMERWEKVKADLPNLQYVVMLQDVEDFSDYEWVLSWDDLVSRGTKALEEPGGRDEFERSWREVKPEDLATLVYTSGTTGPPKAVMITHRNVVWTIASLDRDLKYPTGLKAISYLPLAHVAERLATHYLGMYKRAHVHFCPDVLRVFELVPEVRPQAFLGVPRVWEKVHAGVMATLGAEANERKRKIGMAAIETGREAARLEAEGKPLPLALRLKRALFDKLVYSKIRQKIGLDRSILQVTSAAPISRDTLEFFAGIGLPLLEIYGMTEDTGPATANPPDRIKMGTVGVALPGVEVKLADDGEILVRGGNISPGYYKDPEKTAETFDPDGWLHTGDIGTLDEDGYYRVVDRKKELIITAGGKNISPSNLESLLKRHPLIGQACVVGDGKRYISALIVLDGENAPIWAKENGLSATTVAELSTDPRVTAEIQRAVDDANQHVSQVEQIKRFTILPTEWTVDSEELTPTLKLKRRVIHQKYAEEIEALYA
ncbi:MAG: long-chain fatty acid--CoA ligase [Actinomycetota bacterium]|nr:long-chain fatty acid--CoA ligase [Actinomycetota bacterium]